MDEDELLVLTMDTVFVFKVPPRTSAGGYKCALPTPIACLCNHLIGGCPVLLFVCRAADWGEQVWAGELKVFSKGPNAIIKLTGRDGMRTASVLVGRAR